MPIEYTLEKSGSFVRIRAKGEVTSEELHSFLQALGSDPRLRSDHVTLFDTREVSAAILEDPEFRRALDIERTQPDKLVARKLAILVNQKSLFLEALRYEAVSGQVGEYTRVFVNLNEALLWLAT